MSLLELFCDVDDFCQRYERTERRQLNTGGAKRGPKPQLVLSEVMTIVIHFHQSHYRDFKAYYCQHVLVYLRRDFPGLVSYNRFVELLPRTLLPLVGYLQSRFGSPTGVAFIDSTAL